MLDFNELISKQYGVFKLSCTALSMFLFFRNAVIIELCTIHSECCANSQSIILKMKIHK